MAKKVIGFMILLTAKEREEMETNIWFSEYLRYPGLVSRPEIELVESFDGKLSRGHVLKVNCNFKGHDTKLIAKLNIERLRSFGRWAVEWKV